MQFSLATVLAILAVGTTMVAASPTHHEERKSPAFTGGCNGTSCKIGLINYGCTKGSCTGTGGGDGAYCYAQNSLADGPYICPGA
ncbi:uncharacterized protein K452DRAFT_322868 [Aplosporella prunicola CBS 121167]|uniref:Uncharacterized protein n=1 Tax=Aplosporella prunicola CBS 121167 TaxID=1176127 RepID=A0A6A6AX40_9PEZI|nr:uncharacterized protein K452DRAFT_322868 [Aplosporella prunicola CBS 121167]KAF2135743.1 hypothetical protein K452DRAFT_322868 [Aplosporella prunicola CBS 121167]